MNSNLPPFTALIVPCTGGTITLPGGGASYIVVPNLAAQTDRQFTISYTIGVEGGPSANAIPVQASNFNMMASLNGTRLADSLRRRRFQVRLESALMDEARKELTQGDVGLFPKKKQPHGSIKRPVNPPIGHLAGFQVLSAIDPHRYTRVGARLAFLGTNIQLYIDTLAPPPGFTPEQIQVIGQGLDQTYYPINVNMFGEPTDIDRNEHVIVLLTPIVNQLIPQECDPTSLTVGMFNPIDLVLKSKRSHGGHGSSWGSDSTWGGDSDSGMESSSEQDSGLNEESNSIAASKRHHDNRAPKNSNQGEIFYGGVPDPNGLVSCALPVRFISGDMPASFLHQFEHMISFGHHVTIDGGVPENGWLDEGLAFIGEEAGSIHWEAIFPPPAGRSNPNQLFPDSSQVFSTAFFYSYAYLFRPDTVGLLDHTVIEDGQQWRGGEWLLLRYIGDQHGNDVFQRLIDSGPLRGTANVEAATGVPFDSTFGNFSLAVYVDSLPGVPESDIPLANQFTSRNLREIYFRMNKIGIDNPREFPILPTPLVGTIEATIVPGTMSFYTLTTTPEQESVTITFNIDADPAVVHPQVSVFRTN